MVRTGEKEEDGEEGRMVKRGGEEDGEEGRRGRWEDGKDGR